MGFEIPDERCQEFGAAHAPHVWADDEFPDDWFACDGAETPGWAYERGRREERQKIAWWLRASCDGPALVNTEPVVLEELRRLADLLDGDGERWSCAPVRGDGEEPRRPGVLGPPRTTEEKVAFRKAWDQRVVDGGSQPG